METPHLDYDDQEEYGADSMLDIFYSGNNNDEEVHILNLDGTRVDTPNSPMDCEDNESNEPSTSSGTIDPIIKKPKKTKGKSKKTRKPEIWKRNAEKIKKNKGQEFVNRAGTVKQARELKPPCKETCPKRCWESLSEDNRNQIFKQFWDIGDHTLQLQYLSKHIERLDKKRVRGNDETSRRKWSYNYYFTLGERHLNVCKLMFVNTLIISDSWLKTTIRKKEEDENGVTIKDKRGHYAHTQSIRHMPEEMKKLVQKHVLDIHFAESKYISTKCLKEYFEQHLSYKRLYKLYCDWFRKNNYSNEHKASVRQYRYVIDNEYQLRFFKPKKDVCPVCDIYDISSEAEKLEKAQQHSFHLASEYTSRQLKLDCKTTGYANKFYVVATYKFQRDLITPMSDRSVFYYKRKLAAYNFTIYDFGKKQGYCYIWDETVGKKGLNEICSAVFSFIEFKVSQGAKEFVFFSDNCGSNPNRSPAIFTMYYYAAHKFKVDISHIFFEFGHTQIDEYTMKVVIERAKKDKVVYVPNEWISLLKGAKTSGNPYIVTVFDQNMILDFKNLFSNLPNVDFDIDGVKIKWDDVNHVRIIKDCSLMKLGYNLYAEEVLFIDFLNKPDILITDYNELVKPFILPNVLDRAYDKPILISEEKHRDLLKLCERKYIPVEYHDYYINLEHKKKKKAKKNYTI